MSSLAGEEYVKLPTTSRQTGFTWPNPPTTTESFHWERRPRLPPNAINRLAPGTALAIGPQTGPFTIALNPCWEPPFSLG